MRGKAQTGFGSVQFVGVADGIVVRSPCLGALGILGSFLRIGLFNWRFRK